MAMKYAERHRQIGLKIAYYRKLRGMTQEGLSEKLNKSLTHIGSVEATNVERALSLNTLFEIADLLEVPPYKFLLFEEDEKP